MVKAKSVESSNYPKNYPNCEIAPENLAAAFWQRFFEISRIPRPSKKEGKIIEYILNEAKKKNFFAKTDTIGNVLINIPGSNGRENESAVILQAHVDMVCEKLPEKKFDFEKDPIELRVDSDGWIRAEGTTLGADNGVGVAIMLSLLDLSSLGLITNPPLELLFTVDEETGLKGALNLDGSMLRGKRLINLDTEEWGSIFVGCAGGIDLHLTGVFPENQIIEGDQIKIQIKGLKGGHSGMDIHIGRCNAVRTLGDLLWEMKDIKFDILEFFGGSAHNVIPRDAYVVINVPKKISKVIKEKCDAYLPIMKKRLNQDDLNVEIVVDALDEKNNQILKNGLVGKERDRFLALLKIIPHGAVNYRWDLDPVVTSMSSNFAICRLQKGKLFIEKSIRFFERSGVNPFLNQLEAISKIFLIEIEKKSEYPSWTPIFDNDLVRVCNNTFKELYGRTMHIKAVHAGLECGIIKSKIPNLDAVSIGPNITAVHSPSEGMEIDSCTKFVEYFLHVLRGL